MTMKPDQPTSPKAQAAAPAPVRERRRVKVARYLRTAAIVAGLAVPALSLIPLGSLWLWQNGYLLYWALAACVTTGLAFAAQRFLFPVEAQVVASDAADPDAEIPGHTPREAEAWREVRRLATGTQPDSLYSQDSALAVAADVVDRVAHIMRPGVKEPIWHFTAPEVLALIEQVSRRLRLFVDENVPLGDRLTIAQALQLYRWRGVIDTAQSAYDIWRLVRLLNPLTAVTHEIRERLSHQLYDWSRDHVAKRLAEAYIEEIGRAAIDLYSGRLRVIGSDPERLHEQVVPVDATAADRPLRIFVGGQVNAGKSRLVNALGQEAGAAVDLVPTTSAFTAFTIGRDELPGAVIIDSPGLRSDAKQRRETIDIAADCDLVVWVVAAHRADRDVDRAALADLRHHFAAQPDRRPPPILLVLSHIDQLRPWGEWQPPYDVANPTTPKARTIRDAMMAAATDLAFPLDEVVPACLDPTVGLYNVDVIWARIVDLAPDARQTQLVRLLRTGTKTGQWRRLWTQASNAGRVIAGQIVTASKSKRD